MAESGETEGGGRRMPLGGVRVVEAVAPEAPDALATAIGLCGRIACDLGAQVTRIGGAAAPPSASEKFLHTGKTRAASYGDIADAAAVLLDPSSYETLGPRLGDAIPVVVAMSDDAPSSGTEFTIEARSGLLDLIGDPAREPLRLGGHQTAYAAGLSAYLGLVAALTRRRSGLPAGPVRVDLLDVAVWLNWKTLSMTARTGSTPTRAGAGAEWAVVACADGHAAIVYRVQEWQSLLAATGDPRLREARFATPADRRANRPALNAILAQIFAPMTRAEIKALSLAYKLPLGPVWTVGELRSDPHMLARGFFTTLDDGTVLPTVPVKWNGHGFGPVEHALLAAE